MHFYAPKNRNSDGWHLCHCCLRTISDLEMYTVSWAEKKRRRQSWETEEVIPSPNIFRIWKWMVKKDVQSYPFWLVSGRNCSVVGLQLDCDFRTWGLLLCRGWSECCRWRWAKYGDPRTIDDLYYMMHFPHRGWFMWKSFPNIFPIHVRE